MSLRGVELPFLGYAIGLDSALVRTANPLDSTASNFRNTLRFVSPTVLPLRGGDVEVTPFHFKPFTIGYLL